MKLYRPSNGTEGEIFHERHCYQCIHCDPDPSGDKQCNILLRTLIHSINEPEYPKEWCYIDGTPTCTSWVKWDWGNDCNPYDPDNPKAPIPYDPNQLLLFSEADEIFNTKTEEHYVIT